MQVKLELWRPNEVFANDAPRRFYRPVLDELERMGARGWEERTRRVKGQLLTEQHGYGIKHDDRTHPTDWFPRLVPADDWERLERGLSQRMRAANQFLRRLEVGKEEVVPREDIGSSALYDASTLDRFGDAPARQMGFDLVAVEDPNGS